MKKNHLKQGPIQEWGRKINWERRIKAVCKPCWEIKYCPYGPLVENLPLKIKRDEKSCRIFGHDCPVFYVAEPLTETKELRNVSRVIPRVTQFRVFKRENQICAICGKSVKDEYIEFDHIIPWSKGGSSDEHNIMLLCKSCNRKKGKSFEKDYLVNSFSEHIIEPINIGFIRVIIELIKLAHEIFKKDNILPSSYDFCRFFGRRKVRYEHEKAAEMISDFDKIFKLRSPAEIEPNIFKALKFRWGFVDRKFHKLGEASKIYKIEINKLLAGEMLLLNRLGWQTKNIESINKKWLSL